MKLADTFWNLFIVLSREGEHKTLETSVRDIWKNLYVIRYFEGQKIATNNSVSYLQKPIK